MSEKRVLIVRIGAMGDVLHALPAVAALRQQWPKAAIDWAVDTRWAPLLVSPGGVGPIVSQVHEAATRAWSRAPFSRATWRSVLTLRQELRAAPYDYAVDMQGTLRSASIGRLAASERRAGYLDPREGPARVFYDRRIERRSTHVVEQGASLLSEALGLVLTPVPPTLPVDAAAAAWAETRLGSGTARKRVALLAPTAGWAAKQWPTARFGAVARTLSHGGWTVLVNVAAAGDATAAAVVEGSRDGARPVPSSLAQLIALLRRTDLVLGGDSGPVHLAAALGTPLVALFGPTDPARNGPWGPGPKQILRHPASATSYKHVNKVDPGLAQLSVEQVLAAVETVTRV